jgi:hypothetical protein
LRVPRGSPEARVLVVVGLYLIQHLPDAGSN